MENKDDIDIQTLTYISDDSNFTEVKEQEDKVLIAKLADDTAYLKSITNLNKLITNDGEQIATAELHIKDATETIQETKDTLDTAHKSQKKTLILKGTIISTCVGACIGGPIGGILGNTVNLTAMGLFLGSISMGGFMGTMANVVLRR